MLIRSAVEKLVGIEAPGRAEYIRMIVSELSRIAAPGCNWNICDGRRRCYNGYVDFP